MVIYGLPGRNQNTESWMGRHFSALGIVQGEIAHYRHWNESGEADVEFEARRLQGRSENRRLS